MTMQAIPTTSRPRIGEVQVVSSFARASPAPPIGTVPIGRAALGSLLLHKFSRGGRPLRRRRVRGGPRQRQASLVRTLLPLLRPPPMRRDIRGKDGGQFAFDAFQPILCNNL